MPRVSTQKAAKDYPDQGIKKGDQYFHWKFRFGGVVWFINVMTGNNVVERMAK